jgi:hypothetical protein
MKQIVALLLAGTFVFGLSGCGGSDGAQGETDSGAQQAAAQIQENDQSAADTDSQDTDAVSVGMDAAAEDLFANRSYYNGIISVCTDTAIALKSDGTVYATSSDDPDLQSKVSDWDHIKWVCAGDDFVMGVREDGTVVMTDPPAERAAAVAFASVASWTDIEQLSCGGPFVLGLRSDGTVISSDLTNPDLDSGQTDVGDWTDIVQIQATYYMSLGLKSDGTCVGTPISITTARWAYDGTKVQDWTDVVSVAAGYDWIVGIRSDGTASCIGLSHKKQIDKVTNGFMVAGDSNYLVVLSRDGTCNDVYGTGEWEDIVAVAMGNIVCLGVTADGRVLRSDYSGDDLLDAASWTDIKV